MEYCGKQVLRVETSPGVTVGGSLPPKVTLLIIKSLLRLCVMNPPSGHLLLCARMSAEGISIYIPHCSEEGPRLLHVWYQTRHSSAHNNLTRTQVVTSVIGGSH